MYSLCFLILSALGVAASPQLEVAAKLNQAVGNVTMTPDHRLFFSYHPFYGPKIRVVEQLQDGSVRPFPSLAWNTPHSNSSQYLDSVLGLRSDEQGIVWMLDAGNRNNVTPKIVAWDTREDKLHRVIALPALVSLPTSFHNDLVVDHLHEALIIADEGIANGGNGENAALVVVDLKTGKARRLLQGHWSTLPENIDLRDTELKNVLTVSTQDGGVTPLKIGVDGIALDEKKEWLYYGPLSGKSLYRIRTADLFNADLTERELEDRVERFSDKPINGGLSIDHRGNIYLTEVLNHAIGMIGPDRVYRQIINVPELQWPDGISYGADGYMYVSAAQVHLAAAFNDGKTRNQAPYFLFKFRPFAPGTIGH